MTHGACRLTAKNRNQLRNPTLGSRVWTTFTCLGLTHNTCLIVLPYSYVPQAKVQWPRPLSDWQLIRSDWHLFVYLHLPITAPTQFRAISHHGWISRYVSRKPCSKQWTVTSDKISVVQMIKTGRIVRCSNETETAEMGLETFRR